MDRLYRGMSDLELKCWVDKGEIPKEKLFTQDPEEAVKLGEFYLSEGNLIIFRTSIEDFYSPIHNSSPDGKNGSWYKTNRRVEVDELTELDIFSPAELLRELNSARQQDNNYKSSFLMNYR